MNAHRISIDDSPHWDEEYKEQGIPSSWKQDPSSVVLWGLQNLKWLGEPSTGPLLDVGCGTGRNTIAGATMLSVDAVGIDYSSEAVARARERLARSQPPVTQRVTFHPADIRRPLAFDADSFGIAFDIFVYFHLLDGSDREHYRRELKRVLRPRGLLLLSLATAADGYYSNCPVQEEWRAKSNVPVVLDTHAGVGNIMHSLETLRREMEPEFSMCMAWQKPASGIMHGREYKRATLATLWRTEPES